MNWIVLYEKSGKIVLTSKKKTNSGLLPKGSYITVDMSLNDSSDNRKFVLRVEESEQTEIYSPSPLLADLNLDLQEADRECKNQITAYKAKKITSAINLNKINYYKLYKYWEKIIPEDNYFIIERDEFYILRSKEKIIVKNNQAAELEPFKDSFGNFRVHYAGFFDPGFGNNKLGTPAVLELRAYDTPFIIRDGQLVGQLNYYQIDEIKKKIYGINIQSNYYNQNLKLAKQFK